MEVGAMGLGAYLLAVPAALCLLPALAAAQEPELVKPRCGGRADMLRTFGWANQLPHVMAITSEGNILEVYRSRDGDWAIMITPPQRPSCVTAHGPFWEDIIGESGS
jgi:hypothetical protein